MRHSLILILFLLCRMVLYCQSDSAKPEPYVYFNAVSVIAGFVGTEYQSHDLDHFKALSPGNSITRSIPASVEQRVKNNNSGNAGINFGLNLHLKTKDFKTKLGTFSSEWRMGLNISSNLAEMYTFSKQTSLGTDTFYSNHTPMVVYEEHKTDSIYQFSYRSSNVYLDLSKTYHTDQKKRISFYTGINFGLGYTFNNSLNVTSAIDSSRNGELRENYSRLGRFYGTSTETTALNPELFYSASIPVGMMLRTKLKTKRHHFHFAVFAEGRFGYRFQKNYTSSYSSTPLGAVQMGLKFYFNPS